jgi:hypothetical protein
VLSVLFVGKRRVMDKKDNIIKFPEIREYNGSLTINRSLILPYANIGFCKIMDYKNIDSYEAVTVNLTIQGDCRISIIAQNQEEAEEIVKELTKLRMDSPNREDSIKSNYSKNTNDRD